MAFPDSVLEEIKSRIDLVNYISRYVDLKRAGANFKGLCPFHQEKTPSFMVSPSKAIYKCFGCGAGGNLFTFVRDTDSVSFTEAVKLLAKEAGVNVEPYLGRGPGKEEKSLQESLYQINDEARDFFKRALKSPAGAAARAYLDKRGLAADTAERFSLGYAPAEWEALYRHLRQKGFDEKIIHASGLVAVKQGGRVADKFHHRFMIPIQNLSGLTCGFTGRVLDDKDVPKYMNSPETPVFQKGRVLYGLLQAREAVRKTGWALIVEGNVDLLTLAQGGVPNIAASSGTAFTEQQALLLKRFCDRVTILYDGDPAGQDAARRGIHVLINAGLMVRIAVLPKGDDPDSYFRKKGLEALLALVDKGRDMIDFIVDGFEQRFGLDAPENKSKLAREIAPVLSAIADPILKAEFLKKASLRTGVREDLLLRVKAPGSSTPRRGAAAQPGEPPRPKSREEKFEEAVITLLVRDSERNLTPVKRFIAESDFTNPAYREVFRLIVAQNGFSDTLISSLEPEAQRMVSDMALNESAGQEDVNQVLLKMKENGLRNRQTEIRHLMAKEPANREKLQLEFKAVTEELNDLRKTLSE